MEKNIFFADLHIHSRFSRACSKALDIPNLVKWARIKGLDLLGTGDFTHPTWLKELKELTEENGVLYYEDDNGKFPFILSSEISLIYTDKGKGRRVHLVYLAPSLEAPAHIWTPWFGIFGSKGGYDDLDEAFGDQRDRIHAIETGISSDPAMNWKLKDLKDISIVSFSDSHSFWPWRLGREATIFEFNKGEKISYDLILDQIRNNSFIGTIETDPAYGMYHFDGHRACDFSCSPKETKKLGGFCPKCNKPLTVGVDYRVEELANLDKGSDNKKKYYTLLPLHEIISLGIGMGMNTKGCWKIYNELIEKFETEFNILLNVREEDLMNVLDDKLLVDLIIKNREGKIKVRPGYDGVYGEAILEEDEKELEKQKSLF